VVLVAPPGHHLEIVADGGARLTDTAPVHFSRPSADRLFESAARSCGVISGVILTGAGMDGAAGAVAVRAAGGHVIVQDRATSACFGMPRAAIDAGAADDILPLQNIGPAVLQLARNGYDGYSGIAGI
jgi:two-component system chemotaxis response regulator CheB